MRDKLRVQTLLETSPSGGVNADVDALVAGDV